MPLPEESCDPNTVESYLSDALNESQRVSFEYHLSDCQQCRDQLAGLAVEDPSWWEQPAEFLNSDPLDEQIARALPPTQFDDFNTSVGHDGLRRVIELLKPSTNPDVLGHLEHYEIAEAIGLGGMAIVLKGFEPDLDRFIAIKVMAPHLASSVSARERFAREAKAAASISHPNVIEIYRVAEFQGLPYLVMPYISGGSLQKHLDANGRFSINETLDIGHQIARGLAAAHQEGLIHRDIKPANILFEQGNQQIVITDFGLARAADDANITQTGILAGTPHYMSPEQARGEHLDVRSDLFSFGSVLFTLCSGQVPFKSETSFGVLRKITDHPAPRLRQADPATPIWMENLVHCLHAPNPSNRYDSADQIAKLLSKCLEAQKDPSKKIPLALMPTKPSWPRVLLLAAMSLVAVGFAIWAMNQPGHPPKRNQDSSGIPREAVESPLLAAPSSHSIVWPQDGKWITLSGRFVMEGALPEVVWEEPHRDKTIYKEPIVDESLLVNASDNGIANVFVWLSRTDQQRWPLRRKGDAEKVIDLRFIGGKLAPHCLFIQTTQELLIGNRDPIDHTIKLGGIESGTISAGKALRHQFSNPLSKPLRGSCEYHPWFDCFILVTRHPFVAVSDEHGRFCIEDIPEGKWNLHFWHELPGEIDQVLDDQGFVRPWPDGRREVSFDRPIMDLGELVPDLEQNDAL